MLDRHALVKLITKAFAGVHYPGDGNLIESRLSDEPLRVEADFRGRNDWTILSETFLDQSPGGLGSALTFFSDEAFHFYIAAYMLADLDGKMDRSNPLYYLAPGSNDPLTTGLAGPVRFALGTWGRQASLRFRAFTQEQRQAVSEFLKYRSQLDDLSEDHIELISHAIADFWLSEPEA